MSLFRFVADSQELAGAVGPAASPGCARFVTWAIALLRVSAMYSESVLGSIATWYGLFSFDAVGATPLVSLPAGGIPPLALAELTTVEIVPSGVTSRMALSNVSAMNRSPAPSS